jgi:hypothetical protein
MYGKAGLDSKGIVSKVFEVLQKTEQASKGRA